MYDLLHIHLTEQHTLIVEVSPWLVLIGVSLPLLLIALRSRRRRFRPVSLEVSLGGIGRVQLRPHEEDIEIAHKIWTELVTRKAALPVDEHDVITEVYDSWYALFGRVRSLIAELPARLVRDDQTTQQLVHIATDSLNRGLRPHLTQWQARFRNWYSLQGEALRTSSPQEVQKAFPEYGELMADLRRVNLELIQYAGELHKLVRGR